MTATALSKDIEEYLEALVVQNKAHEAGDRSVEPLLRPFSERTDHRFARGPAAGACLMR
jgi:hypothetical protein